MLAFSPTTPTSLTIQAGLPAMQTTRYIRHTESMLSQASQLPHLTVPAFDLAFAFALQHSSRPGGRCAFAFDFDLRRPVKPRWPNAGFGAWVTRQDAGLAVLGQGWPMTAAHGPKPEPSLGEEPSGGARAFCLLLRFSKVSRCKSGTNSSHNRSNGYAPNQPPNQTRCKWLSQSPAGNSSGLATNGTCRQS
jgi:hypothetical protein